MNPHVQKLYGTPTGTSRNNDLEKRAPTGHCSQKDARPEVELSTCRSSTSFAFDSIPEETSHMVTGVGEDFPYFRHIPRLFVEKLLVIFFVCAWYTTSQLGCLTLCRFRSPQAHAVFSNHSGGQ